MKSRIFVISAKENFLYLKQTLNTEFKALYIS